MRQKHRSLAERMAEASSWPVLHSLVAEKLWEDGLGPVVLSRRLRNSQIGFAVFNLDIYCLGVKDAFGDVVISGKYYSLLHKLEEKFDLAEMEPAAVRKLVEGAVEYARRIGLAPHPEYQRLRPLFGELDPDECDKEFTYGKNGKPLYISGPYESSERRQRIISTLRRTCGPHGFDFVVGMRPEEAEEFEDAYEEDDAYEEEDLYTYW